jgi:hypothetical protein
VLARIILVILLPSGPSALASDSTIAGQPIVSTDGNHFSQRFSRGKNVIVVDVRVRAFQKARHKLRLLDGSVQQVDGREPQGIDGGPPEGLHSEIVGIEVSWNDIRRSVNKALFSDCFNASALPYKVLISEDFKAVMITTFGGDAGSAYGVHWIVPKEADIVRFIVGTEDLTWRLPNKALQRSPLNGKALAA